MNELLITNKTTSAPKDENKLEILKEYNGFADNQYDILEGLRNKVEKGKVYSYRTYIEKNSLGQEFVIDTMGIEINYDQNISKGYDESEEYIIITTKDKNTNKIVGIRSATLTKKIELYDKNHKKKSSYRKISGEIITKIRGKGIASITDIAFLKTIQLIADKRNLNEKDNCPIIWTVTNANLTQIELLKTKANKEEIMKEKIQEQKRWQSLYGEQGKFGFIKKPLSEKEYELIIKPTINKNEVNINIETIDLEKYDNVLEEIKESMN